MKSDWNWMKWFKWEDLVVSMKKCNECNEVSGLFCPPPPPPPPPPLPLKEVLVKHIKGNDGKKLQELEKIKQFDREGQDRIVKSLFSAAEIYEVPFDWCTYVWFLVLKGQFFSGNSHRIYLLGNPVVWWGNLVFLGTFLIIFAYNSIREQRGYRDPPSIKGNVN